MSKHLNFNDLVSSAWKNYDASRTITSISDISAQVSTNHVFKLVLNTGTIIIAKVSYFGFHKHFLEDHSLVNAMAINLPDPYDQFISRSLTKGSELYTYRHKDHIMDAWVVFYNPIKIKNTLPKILDEDQIKNLGREVANFHKSCTSIKNILPPWSKTLNADLNHLLQLLDTPNGQYEHRGNIEIIKAQINTFQENSLTIGTKSWEPIPVFVDWNIGNFSLSDDHTFYSRWDYDWVRMSSRVMDFYFFSRVCSTIGDREEFSYLIDPLNEDRFILFLIEYHKIFPLTKPEVLFIKEAYRFFILNYVVKDGRYFFHEIFATKLQREAYEIYFPNIDQFDSEKILNALKL